MSGTTPPAPLPVWSLSNIFNPAALTSTLSAATMLSIGIAIMTTVKGTPIPQDLPTLFADIAAVLMAISHAMTKGNAP